ncbi:hypothetical protein FB446DRAFT_489195 [Lentinula raphanica]|uniref:Uncharacterized protein n=1 Tax=Lentinula raphanica TaxID=153919 RepID=A0AA38P9M0_9AGAR|nr:hypothetical protein FB446DRAFT_489195 [Lentinula raphanica]KAJ3824356.1 hypothetical protein F5880DRAFT_393380 [Lentinula raphanica]KAJ3838883.1 hypothetical protein F5878DRAFT_150015 [Lentinula raphanica]
MLSNSSTINNTTALHLFILSLLLSNNTCTIVNCNSLLTFALLLYTSSFDYRSTLCFLFAKLPSMLSLPSCRDRVVYIVGLFTRKSWQLSLFIFITTVYLCKHM